jgi:hypothetical protein
MYLQLNFVHHVHYHPYYICALLCSSLKSNARHAVTGPVNSTEFGWEFYGVGQREFPVHAEVSASRAGSDLLEVSMKYELVVRAKHLGLYSICTLEPHTRPRRQVEWLAIQYTHHRTHHHTQKIQE